MQRNVQQQRARQPKARAAPPAQPKRQRQRRRANKKRNGSGKGSGNSMHHLSPLHLGSVPTVVYQGKAFPYSGLVRYDFTTGITSNSAIIVTNIGRSATIGWFLQWPEAGGTGGLLRSIPLSIPAISSSETNGGATSMRAMKASLDVVNRTAMINRGGPITVMNLSQRMTFPGKPSIMEATDWNTWFTGLIDFNRSRSMDLVDFGRPRHSYSYVVDDTRYNDFDSNEGAITDIDYFLSHVGVWGDDSGRVFGDRPMSTIVYLVGKAATSQSCTLTARGAFYTRWPVTTVQGQSETHIPTTTPQRHNTIVHQAAVHADHQPSFTEQIERTANVVTSVMGAGRGAYNALNALRPLLG